MKRLLILSLLLATVLPTGAQILDTGVGKARQWMRTDFTVHVKGTGGNPYLQEEAALDLILVAPSGKTRSLPCFFVEGETWAARFLPQEKGVYQYHFVYTEKGEVVSESPVARLRVRAPRRRDHGILHAHDNWTFRLDDGTLLRGVGENLCWESREKDDSRFFSQLHEQHERFNYDAMLPALAANGGNFCRMWMCSWNFPIDRKADFNNIRYTPSEAYFNPSVVARLDHTLALAERLGIYIMLCMGPGDVTTGPEFFTDEAAKARYRNYLRYIVSRWGYSPAIGAWEFFNEIDNIQFQRADAPIPATDIVAWHTEMAAYLRGIDPHGHLVTTSISHRDLEGLNDIPGIDFNQKHIYCATSAIPGTITSYEERHGKPYVIGEFGYEWDWSKNFDDFAEEMMTDFRRGLWYGIFSPTPIAPMSWWWEWFDEHGAGPYLRKVRRVSDAMLKAGKGRFEPLEATAPGAEAYAVRCGKRIWVYVYNASKEPVNEVSVRVDGVIRTLHTALAPGGEAVLKTR